MRMTRRARTDSVFDVRLRASGRESDAESATARRRAGGHKAALEVAGRSGGARLPQRLCGRPAGTRASRSRRSAAAALERHRRPRSTALAGGLSAQSSARLEAEAVEVAVAVAQQARAGADRARAVRRDRGARGRLLPPSRSAPRTWSCGSTTRSTPRRASGSQRSRACAASRAAWWCWPSPTSAPAIAASNGPTAASIRDRAAVEAAIDEAVDRYRRGARATPTSWMPVERLEP